MESRPGVDPKDVPVEEAMTADVYTTTPDAPKRKVVREMAARKVGSAVIMEGGAVVGVFTTIDALEALSVVMGSVVMGSVANTHT